MPTTTPTSPARRPTHAPLRTRCSAKLRAPWGPLPAAYRARAHFRRFGPSGKMPSSRENSKDLEPMVYKCCALLPTCKGGPDLQDRPPISKIGLCCQGRSSMPSSMRPGSLAPLHAGASTAACHQDRADASSKDFRANEDETCTAQETRGGTTTHHTNATHILSHATCADVNQNGL